MKIALLFWGLTRSLKYTINSIKTNIFKPLIDSNIDYDIFLHTFYFDGLFTNKRTNEFNIKLDFEEYKLLNPNYYLIENQDKVKKKINLDEYKSKKLCYDNQTMNNLILSLYSLKQVTKLLKYNKNKYQFCIFLRPDMNYFQKFNINWLKKINNSQTGLVPIFQAPRNSYNDRFFIGSYKISLKYGFIFNDLLKYSKKNKVIAEKFLFDCFNINIFVIKKINFCFQRIRSNGKVAYLDRNLIKL